MNDMSLIVEFVQEAREYIDEVEPTLIEIYNGSDELGAIDSELINAVFRLFHSMKGSAGFLALNTIALVTHQAETLLDKIRNNKLSLTIEITETLCKTLDLFREMLDQIAVTGEDSGFDPQANTIIEKLKDHSGENAKTASEPDTTAPTMMPEVVPTVAEKESRAIEPGDEKKFVELSKIEANDSDTVLISPEMRMGFVQEGNEQIDGIEQSLLKAIEERPNADEHLKEAFRDIHSFKGNCGFMGFVALERLSHATETFLDMLRIGIVPAESENVGQILKLLDILREGVASVEAGGGGQIYNCEEYIKTLNDIMMIKDDDSIQGGQAISVVESAESPDAAVHSASTEEKADVSDQILAAKSQEPSATFPVNKNNNTAKTSSKQDIRVDLHKLDSLIDLVGELVIAESMVTRCPAVASVENEYYNRAKHQLRRICDDLKDVAMSVRMIPLSATFRKMVRLVHDLATKSGKKIKLNIVGEDTEVDKTVIEQIADPLVHIVRNSCDHGVEGPEDRIAAGKSETGTITLEGRHEGGEVWILISDDGHGLCRDKVLAKAMEKGIVGPEAKDWPDEKVYRLIFEAGFSTADKVTDISGRGVGMDVVRKNIEKLNGRIDIQNVEGQGATFTLRIPLTLAIIDAMLVRVGSAKYMIPTLAILESIVPTAKQVTVLPDGKEILRLREEMIPIIRLYDVFKQQGDSERLKDGILIIVEEAAQSYAIFVDEIMGQQQAVIKGLPDYIGRAEGFSGCTILGDGMVSLIIDIGTLCQMQGTFVASACDKDKYWTDHSKEEIVNAVKSRPATDFLANYPADNVTWEDLENAVATVANLGHENSEKLVAGKN